MKEAEYYTRHSNNKVQCNLCPHNCILSENQTGLCNVRQNINGKLFANSYMKICSMALDPIEKKPLFHFFPGKKILSVGSVGCNLSCKFCQNFEISQSGVTEYKYLTDISTEKIITEASRINDNCGIAFTYNEPTVGFEFVKEVSLSAKASGFNTAFISNGHINPSPLKELFNSIDAFNIDLKAFDEKFYETYTGGKLSAVKETLKLISENNKHLEITNLVIPHLNDNIETFKDMVKWISNSLGKNTPLHLSGYFPRYKLKIEATPVKTLNSFYDIAKEYLNYVYIGNIYSFPGSNTNCPSCNNTLIERIRYNINIEGLNKDGFCKYCNEPIITLRSIIN